MSKTFGAFKISISRCMAKLPLQGQRGVTQLEQRESQASDDFLYANR